MNTTVKSALALAAAVAPEEPTAAEPAGLGIALGAAAEAHLYAGELTEAHAGLLAAARAHRRAGRLVAAVDACDLAIGLAPADPDLHLLLAELYLDRGWRTLATDKLLLLGRIAELDEDRATRDRLAPRDSLTAISSRRATVFARTRLPAFAQASSITRNRARSMGWAICAKSRCTCSPAKALGRGRPRRTK